MFINVSKDLLVPFIMKAASSANNDVLYSFPAIRIPFISLFFLTALDNSSIQIINKYGERGQPCLTPRRILKKSDK